MEIETWRPHPISGYLVSNTGKVKNPRTGYVLKPTKSYSGYASISRNICSGCSVHCAVVEAFIGLIPKGMQVNHKDGDKWNNNLGNLEIVTPSENVRHAYSTGLNQGLSGEDNYASKLTTENVLQMYELFKLGFNNDAVGNMFSVHSRYVSLIRHGHRWKHLYTEHLPRSFSYVYPLALIIEAYWLVRCGLSNKEVSQRTCIEVSNISRLKHRKIWNDFIMYYESRAATTIETVESKGVE